MEREEKRFRLAILLTLAVLGTIAYTTTLDGGWVWDDASSVLLHKHVQDPAKLIQLFREDQHRFGEGQGNFYRPLLSVTFMIDYLLSYDPALDAGGAMPWPDVKPLVFHLTSLGWHIAAAMLFFMLLTRLGAPRFVRGAAALIYVLHPLHTEAVAYISGRADMMSAVFMYAALLSAIKKKPLAWVFCGLFFICGLLSKESTFIFPFLLALFVLLRPFDAGEKQAAKKEVYLRRSIPLGISVVILAGYGILRTTVLHFGESGGGTGAGFFERLVETCQAFAFYISVLFRPAHLHMEQTLAGASGWSAAAGAVLLAFFILVFAVALRTGRRRVALGLGWFLLTWLPISGIFPLNAPMAEHWMYVPMAGFWWALLELVWSEAYSPAMKKAVTLAVWAVCLAFMILTAARNQEWGSNEKLFRATLRENPDTYRVHYNLAVTYEDLEGNLPGARRHYEEVLRILGAGKEGDYLLDGEIDAHLSLGRVLLRMGEYYPALSHYQIVAGLKQDGGSDEIRMRRRAQQSAAILGMGRCLLVLGDLANAQTLLQQAVALNPGYYSEVETLLSDGALIQEQ